MTSHPLFQKALAINLDEKGQKAGVVDYLQRQSGIEYIIQRDKKLIEASDDPAAYLQKRTARLGEISGILSTIYADEFRRLLELGYTGEKAKKEAMKRVAAEKNRLLKNIDEEFPLEIVKVAEKKLLTKSVDSKGKEEKVSDF